MKRVQISLDKNNFYLNLNIYKDLENELINNYNLLENQYYITSRTKLIGTDWDFNKNNEIYYIVHHKVIGGGMMGDLKKIGKFFADLPKIFTKLGLFLKWIFYDLPKWLIKDLLNPINILNDIITGIFAVLRLLALGFLDGISGIIKYLINLVFTPIVSGFWGYVPKDDKNPDTNNARMRSFEQPTSKVAFPVIISTVILPPMGLFMELGLKGWMNLLICSILTLCYYFPGLIYALIILYC